MDPITVKSSGMRLTLAALIALAVLLVACGSPQRPAPASGPRPPEAAPEILEVVCRADGTTELKTDRVQAMPDGVHIRVDNRAGEDVSLGGIDFPEGVGERVERFEPGRQEVACWPFSRHESPEPEPLPIQVLDPEGYWRSSELECAPGEMESAVTIDYFAEAKGKRGDPEEITRKTVTGLESGDEILTVGYPDAENRKIAIVRDGKMIAVFSYWPAQKDSWLVGDYSTCESSGISTSAGSR